MQVWLKQRSLGMSILVLAWAMLMGTAEAQWQNDEPWWEYEDSTPQIPVDVRMKRFNLDMAYNKAGDYHNEHFKREYTRREYNNAAFKRGWLSFRARWLAFSDYLERFQRSVLLNASSVSASRTYINIDHARLMGTTRAVFAAMVNSARELTSLLEDDIVTEKWETFIDRLTQVEDALQDF